MWHRVAVANPAITTVSRQLASAHVMEDCAGPPLSLGLRVRTSTRTLGPGRPNLPASIEMGRDVTALWFPCGHVFVSCLLLTRS